MNVGDLEYHSQQFVGDLEAEDFSGAISGCFFLNAVLLFVGSIFMGT